MKSLSFALFALSLAARAATAQTGSQSNLVLTIYGGVASGNGLWSIARQPLNVLCSTAGACGIDTLRLSREMSSGVIAGAGASYFTNSHLGFTAEIFYLDIPLDDGCTGLFNPDAESRNLQVCNNIASASLSTSAIGFFGGAVLRASSTHALSPYVRAGIGILAYSTGTVEMSGDFVSGGTVQSRAVLIDPSPKTSAVTGLVAVGVTARLSPGYQFRFELRNLPVPLDRVTGAAPLTTLEPPKGTHAYNRIALTVGLDVILEKKRGRRY